MSNEGELGVAEFMFAHEHAAEASRHAAEQLRELGLQALAIVDACEGFDVEQFARYENAQDLFYEAHERGFARVLRFSHGVSELKLAHTTNPCRLMAS